MSHRPKEPPVPGEKRETERREIMAVLEGGEPLSAKDISGYVRIPEKKVYEHLEHIRLTVEHAGRRFQVVPAECKLCGFVFSKRDRLGKPGKCPVCRRQSIEPPLFSITARSH